MRESKSEKKTKLSRRDKETIECGAKTTMPTAVACPRISRWGFNARGNEASPGWTKLEAWKSESGSEAASLPPAGGAL